MKKMFVSLASFLLLAFTAQSQCGQDVTWTAQKTDYLDAAGTVQRTSSTPVTIRTTPTQVTITTKTADDQTEVITGKVDGLQCNWKEAFVAGKTSFKSVLAKSNGETKNAMITIEGADGKLTMTVELENMNGMKMRLPLTVSK